MTYLRLSGRYLALIFLSACAGGFASLLNPLLAIRGALLGVTLALGTLAINLLNTKRLRNDMPPRVWTVLMASIAVGFLGGLYVDVFIVMPPAPSPDAMNFHIPHTTTGWPTVLTVTCYSLILHFVYAQRWRQKKRSKPKLVLYALLVSPFMTLLRTGLDAFRSSEINISSVESLLSDPFGALVVWIFFSALTTLPFVIPWILVTCQLDPAWSLDRWRRLH